MRWRLTVLVLLGFAAFGWLGSCSDDPAGPEMSSEEADVLASQWMQALVDTLQNLPDDSDPESFRGIDFSAIRNGMNQALAGNSTSKVAHLGSALLDVLEINYDADLWAFIDSLRAHTDDDDVAPSPPGDIRGGLYLRPGSPIIGNQFALLATAPCEYLRLAAGDFPANVTVANLQQILENVVLAALVSAHDHLLVAEGGEGPRIFLTVEDETSEIDVGEVYIFHAGVLAASAAFRMLTAYDMDLFGSDGTYSWIDDMQALDRCDEDGYFQTIGVDSVLAVQILYDERTPTNAAEDSLGVAVLQYNLQSRPAFLGKKNSGFALAYQDLLGVRDMLVDAVAAIRAEGDAQEDDIVKIVNLTELDDEIASDPDKPTFAEGFTTIEHVLNWVGQVLGGVYHLVDQGKNGLIELDVNISAFLQGSPPDFKALLPYHRFRDPGDWIRTELDRQYDIPQMNPGWYEIMSCAGPISSGNVVVHRIEYYRVHVDPLLFTTAGGDSIDINTEKIPHMPDYMFGGLFPGASRDTWIAIHDAAGW